MRKPTILIVDDEKNTREGLARALQFNYRVLLADSGARALEVLDEEAVELVLSDIRMPGMDGLALLHRIRARTPQPVVILLTAYGSIEQAVEAMRAGAYDFLTKPVSLDRLDILLRRALEARDMASENRRLRERLDQNFGMENITGRSPAMREVFDTIRQVAPARTTVLIEGESGTGKELVAQALHHLSPRAQGPFVAVHCAALAPTLLESELFGHEKGAFTGASERRRGRFEMADGGTLFLDEIGEILPAVQVKILRVLEEHRFERVGGQQTLEVDVRLIAATNRNLRRMVEEGQFREDLFFRLNVVSVVLPPLRERAGDIPLLVDRFLKELAEENHRPAPALAPEVMDVLVSYAWPGNVRELRNAIERMVVLGRGDRLTLRDLPPPIRPAAAAMTQTRLPGAVSPDGGTLTMDQMERQLILTTLEQNAGNRVKTAGVLGISRRTLHRKLKEYGLAGTGRRGRRPKGKPVPEP